jgi:hypothetical protein
VKSPVLYESEYGNTQQLAIARSLTYPFRMLSE